MIDEEQIVAGAGLERNLTNGDAVAGGEIDLLAIRHNPAGRDELGVDVFACGSFGCHGAGEMLVEGKADLRYGDVNSRWQQAR